MTDSPHALQERTRILNEPCPTCGGEVLARDLGTHVDDAPTQWALDDLDCLGEGCLLKVSDFPDAQP